MQKWAIHAMSVHSNKNSARKCFRRKSCHNPNSSPATFALRPRLRRHRHRHIGKGRQSRLWHATAEYNILLPSFLRLLKSKSHRKRGSEKRSHAGQIDQIYHDLDNLDPNPPFRDVVQDLYSRDQTQETRARSCR